MFGISGESLTPDEVSIIRNEDLGGVILFSRNFKDPAQLAELVNSIQKLRGDYPLFIGVDQEGGRVQRFKNQFSHFPSMLELSRHDSPKLVFEVHEVMAKELAACGVNLNFSPCCDILTNQDNKVIGDRSFGDTADKVEKMISAAIRGLQTNNILACPKHFPGHGGTSKDSHIDLPLVKTSLEELKKREVSPFVKATKSRVEFMMMGHLQVDALDENLPTSLSPSAYAFLRQETKFSKIIITDDLEMGAISQKFSAEEAAVLALIAGADILLFQSATNGIKALESVKQALKTKKLIKADLVEKIQKIISVKAESFKNYQPIYIPEITQSFHSVEAKRLLELLKSKDR